MPESPPVAVVFVCVENACRSQMAEAFARIHGKETATAYSAGSAPGGKVNPKAIAAMAERGYDLTTHRCRSLDDLPDVPFAAAVTMGCGDACPMVRAERRISWDIPDPKHLDAGAFREIRDLIEEKVCALLSELGVRRDG